MIPAPERVKIVHALECAATVTKPLQDTCTQQEKNNIFYVAHARNVAVQQHGKHASTTVGLCSLRGLCQGVILKTNGSTVQLRVQLWSVNQQATA
jgi:hypothetical protein